MLSKISRFSKSTFSKPSFAIFLLIFASLGSYLVLNSFAASNPNIYIAQNATGTASGADCANAEPASFFNVSTNWGANSNQIGPGTTVHLCGSINISLTAQGNGASSNPINLQWESGARLSEAVCPSSGCVNISNRSYITLDGGSNGVIEDTANGTGLANKVSASVGILAADCSNCTVKNLTVQNMYLHTLLSDTSIDHTQNNAIKFSGSNITIANNTIHDVGWALYQDQRTCTDTNVTINGNNIYNTDHSWALVANNCAGGSIGPYYFYGNHLHDWSNWDTTTDAYHHDGIHCYTSDSGTGAAAHYNGLYIYDNRFDGQTDLSGSPTGDNMTADIFLEGGSGAGATPCSDSTSPIYLFNNVASGSEPINNGVFGVFSGNPLIYNNTLIASTTSSGVGYLTNSAVEGETFENNVVTTASQVINTSPSFFAASQPDYNLYANGGSNSFVCKGSFFNFSQFASWKVCMSADSHSDIAASASLNPDGSPQLGSPAITAGTNLTNLCSGQPNPGLGALCSDINGNARPISGAWDIGAYQFSGSSGGGPVVGDLNNDGHVNVFDLSIFLSHWQQAGSSLPEDFNHDNTVNIFDLSILLSHYGS